MQYNSLRSMMLSIETQIPDSQVIMKVKKQYGY